MKPKKPQSGIYVTQIEKLKHPGDCFTTHMASNPFYQAAAARGFKIRTTKLCDGSAIITRI